MISLRILNLNRVVICPDGYNVSSSEKDRRENAFKAPLTKHIMKKQAFRSRQSQGVLFKFFCYPIKTPEGPISLEFCPKWKKFKG